MPIRFFLLVLIVKERFVLQLIEDRIYLVVLQQFDRYFLKQKNLQSWKYGRNYNKSPMAIRVTRKTNKIIASRQLLFSWNAALSFRPAALQESIHGTDGAGSRYINKNDSRDLRRRHIVRCGKNPCTPFPLRPASPYPPHRVYGARRLGLLYIHMALFWHRDLILGHIRYTNELAGGGYL